MHGAPSPDAGRGILARWLLGAWIPASDDAFDGDGEALERMQRLAWAEGVTVLVGDRLARCADVPMPLRRMCQEWVRGQALAELGQRVRLRAVLACLRQAGIDVLLLKGKALAQWLYAEPYLRESSDVDLLFGTRDDALRAADALTAMGYVASPLTGRFRHELTCRSGDGALDLDLHWALSAWPVLHRLPTFAVLHEASIPLPDLGEGVRGLHASHALLHACVHRASNVTAGLGDRLKWLYDVHLLVAAVGRADAWPCCLEDCRRAQVCGIVAEGLAATAGMFGTVVPEDVLRSLAGQRRTEPLDASRLGDWAYIQRSNFRALKGWRNRFAWLGDRLLPASGHLHALYGERQGYPALLWRRLRRGIVRLARRG